MADLPKDGAAFPGGAYDVPVGFQVDPQPVGRGGLDRPGEVFAELDGPAHGAAPGVDPRRADLPGELQLLQKPGELAVVRQVAVPRDGDAAEPALLQPGAHPRDILVADPFRDDLLADAVDGGELHVGKPEFPGGVQRRYEIVAGHAVGTEPKRGEVQHP